MKYEGLFYLPSEWYFWSAVSNKNVEMAILVVYTEQKW